MFCWDMKYNTMSVVLFVVYYSQNVRPISTTKNSNKKFWWHTSRHILSISSTPTSFPSSNGDLLLFPLHYYTAVASQSEVYQQSGYLSHNVPISCVIPTVRFHGIIVTMCNCCKEQAQNAL
jgi:hypothetical protein